jgi:NTE family protein
MHGVIGLGRRAVFAFHAEILSCVGWRRSAPLQGLEWTKVTNIGADVLPTFGQEATLRALVLSGGGNFGAMQAGSLEVLIEAGLTFDMVVGNSAGALNAISLAADPTAAGVAKMQAVWHKVEAESVGSLSVVNGLRQLVLQQEGLFPSQPYARFLAGHLPAGITTFGELRRLHNIPAYTLAVSLDDGQPRLFGDRDDDRLIDGAMASSALPPYFGPWQADGKRYVDGGVHTNLPIRAAVDRGAEEIVAMWIQPKIPDPESIRGMIAVTSSAFTWMVRSLSGVELEWARAAGIPFRLLPLHPPPDVAFWDFEQPELLFEIGRQAARASLEQQPLSPERWWPALRRRLRHALART